MSTHALRVIAAAVFFLAGCAASPLPGSPGGGGSGAEPGVVKGTVTDAQGDPVPGAEISITGYTGTGALVNRLAITDSAGRYRATVPDGLYDVDGMATVAYAGQTYTLFLSPSDGTCTEAFSSEGIVEDFTLTISGYLPCPIPGDPTNTNSYAGGSVYLYYQDPETLPLDAVLTFVLTPQGPLLDGSTGAAVTKTRTVADLGELSGPLDSTAYLHDVPLGTYTITGTAALPDGSIQALRFGPYLSYAPGPSTTFEFEARLGLPYGTRVTSLDLFDASY